MVVSDPLLVFRSYALLPVLATSEIVVLQLVLLQELLGFGLPLVVLLLFALLGELDALAVALVGLRFASSMLTGGSVPSFFVSFVAISVASHCSRLGRN